MTLRELRRRGASLEQCAAELGRTVYSIRDRLSRLDLYMGRVDRPRAIRPVQRSLQLVTQTYLCSPKMLASHDRRRHVVTTRWIVFWLARRLGASMPHIGRKMGHDHATVSHGIHQVEKRRAADPQYLTETDRLLGILRGQGCEEARS